MVSRHVRYHHINLPVVVVGSLCSARKYPFCLSTQQQLIPLPSSPYFYITFLQFKFFILKWEACPFSLIALSHMQLFFLSVDHQKLWAQEKKLPIKTLWLMPIILRLKISNSRTVLLSCQQSQFLHPHPSELCHKYIPNCHEVDKFRCQKFCFRGNILLENDVCPWILWSACPLPNDLQDYRIWDMPDSVHQTLSSVSIIGHIVFVGFLCTVRKMPEWQYM